MTDEALDRAINALQQAVRDRVADTKEIELRLNLLKEERQRRQTDGRKVGREVVMYERDIRNEDEWSPSARDIIATRTPLRAETLLL
jgi:hypothetical protein